MAAVLAAAAMETDLMRSFFFSDEGRSKMWEVIDIWFQDKGFLAPQNTNIFSYTDTNKDLKYHREKNLV